MISDFLKKIFKKEDISPTQEETSQQDTSENLSKKENEIIDYRKFNDDELNQSIPNILEQYTIPEAILQHKFTHINTTTDNAKLEKVLYGIALGDIAGHPYEGWGFPENADPDNVPLIKDNSTFTDDTVMATAIAEGALYIKNNPNLSYTDQIKLYADKMREYAKRYPDRGYGGNFYDWAVNDEEHEEYMSFGDGSAMRSGGIGAIFDNVEDVIIQAFLSCIPTHSHPEGIKGGIAIAVSVWMALHGYEKNDILNYIVGLYPNGITTIAERGKKFYLAPDMTFDELVSIAPYTCNVSCQYAVPESIINFIYSDDLEGCIRNAFRYWCDTDTVGAISGGIATEFYDTDIEWIKAQIGDKLDCFEKFHQTLKEEYNV